MTANTKGISARFETSLSISWKSESEVTVVPIMVAKVSRSGETIFPMQPSLESISSRKELNLGERIAIRQCDQNDKAALWQLNEQSGPFDIIIDDGSHFQEHIFTSFNILWPFLNPGGIYVIEDLATAYWPEYGGDPEQPPAMRLLFHLCDQMHQAYWRILKPVDADSRVQSVHVSREIAFIYKQ